MAAIIKDRISKLIRTVLESQGLGESEWRRNDCISMVRAIIEAQSGVASQFGTEAWEQAGFVECYKTAISRYGSLENGYLRLLDAEPQLVRRQDDGLSIGDIGLSVVPVGKRQEQEVSGRETMVLCFIGPGYRAYTRATSGIRRVGRPYAVWTVRRPS